MEGVAIGHNFERGPPKDLSTKVCSNLAERFQRRRFFNVHSPYFLFLAWRPSWIKDVAIGHNFVRGPPKDHSTNVWSKSAEQFQRRRFFYVHSPYFLFLAWRPSWMAGVAIGHNFGRGPPKDHSTKVWSKFAEQFQRRRFFCNCGRTTDGRRTTDDGRTDGRRTTDAK